VSKIALIVDFNLCVGERDKFLKIIRLHATGTKVDEEGCLQFDVLIPEDNENRVMLVEMYKDDAALEAHVASPRLKDTRAAYADMIESRTITKTWVNES
jgi:quinol monooxygenase YgiN